MLSLRFDVPFFQRGKFPASVSNASQEIIVPNPWAGRANSAPFDQRMSTPSLPKLEKKVETFFLIAFYLILDVAVGGTNGWFPDGAGNKPWLNGALGVFFLLLWTWLEVVTLTLGSLHHRPLFIYACRCHANFRTGTGQVVQYMAGERRRSRDENVCRFDTFYSF